MTSPNPPSHRNARRRVSSPTTTLRLAFDATGGTFDLSQPSLASKRETGAFLTHHHPSARVSTRWGVLSTSPTPPSHRNVRWGFHHPPLPLQLTFRRDRGLFSTSPTPSSHRNARRRVSSPTTTLRLVFRRDGGVFDSPSHRNTRREVFPPFSSCFDATEGMPAGGYPLSSACFSHFDARRGSLLHLCSPSSIAYLGIMYII